MKIGFIGLGDIGEPIASHLSKEPFELTVTIPANTGARIYLPTTANAQVTQDGATVQPQQEAGSYVIEIGSGSYEFRVQ